MLLSLALIILTGFALRGIFQKLHLPGMLGMLLAGVLLGPFILDLIDPTILAISTDLRKIALIIILVRAGLAIDLKDLRKIGRPALLISFVPALLEMIFVMLLAPALLDITRFEAALLGTVLGAVSPAVVVPKMLQLMEHGKGSQHHVPQLLMAGSSVDNIYNITVFTALLAAYGTKSIDPVTFLRLPAGLLTGLVTGALIGLVLSRLFKIVHMRDTIKVLVILGCALALVGLEPTITSVLPFSGLLAVMALGAAILKSMELLAKRLTGKFSRIWVGAELLLFVLLGAVVDINSAARVGLPVVALILGGLVFRSFGVLLSTLRTALTRRERLYCVIAYLPKATVQAAIGALPLAAGVPAGNTILTAAVIAVLITAPLGAIGLERAEKFLG